MGKTIFTFAAQIFNFLVLLVALKFLVFDRITKGMRDRREAITRKWEDAENKAREADEEREAALKKKEQLDKEKEDILSRAREKAEKQAQTYKEELYESYREQSDSWKKELQEQKQEFFRHLEAEIASGLHKLADRTISMVADKGIQEVSMNKFMSSLENESARGSFKDFRSAFDRSDGHIRCLAPSDLDETLKKRVVSKVEEIFGQRAGLEFEVKPELIIGAELECGGQRLSLSASKYIDEYINYLSSQYEKASATQEKEGSND